MERRESDTLRGFLRLKYETSFRGQIFTGIVIPPSWLAGGDVAVAFFLNIYNGMKNLSVSDVK